MRLTKKIKDDILKHTKEAYPFECCGVLIAVTDSKTKKEYIPCNNLSTVLDQFYIDPKDLVKAESKGSIIAYVHSHPNGTSKPSEPDLVQMSKHSKDWIICGYTPDEEPSIDVYKPNHYVLPLIGRSYHFGLQDCYSILKDYYYRELSINLSDYDRCDKWWETEDTASLFLENFKKEGFIEVTDEIRKHDVILFKIGRTYHINHAGIYLEDGHLNSEDAPKVIGNSLFLHHPYNKKSLREIYGNYWNDRKAMILRHKDLM